MRPRIDVPPPSPPPKPPPNSMPNRPAPRNPPRSPRPNPPPKKPGREAPKPGRAGVEARRGTIDRRHSRCGRRRRRHAERARSAAAERSTTAKARIGCADRRDEKRTGQSDHDRHDQHADRTREVFDMRRHGALPERERWIERHICGGDRETAKVVETIKVVARGDLPDHLWKSPFPIFARLQLGANPGELLDFGFRFPVGRWRRCSSRGRTNRRYRGACRGCRARRHAGRDVRRHGGPGRLVRERLQRGRVD